MNIDNYSEYWAGWARFWKMDVLHSSPADDERLDISGKHAPQDETEKRKFETFSRLISELKNNKKQHAIFLPLLVADITQYETEESDADDENEVTGKNEEKTEILHLEKSQSVEMLDILLGRAKSNERYSVADAFVRILDAGNRCERWKVPLPAIPISIPQERSPFTVNDFCCGLEGTRIRQEFLTFLSQPLDFVTMGDDAAAGCLSLCTLLFDATYDYDLLAQLPDSLKPVENRLRWLDLNVSFSVGSGDAVYAENRRVILGPLTRKLAVLYVLTIKNKSLVSRQPRLTRAQSKKVVWASIKAFCKHMGGKIKLPSSLPVLVKNASMRMRQEIPSIHVTYALDSRVSATLPKSAWERLISPPETYALEKPEPIAEIEQDTRNQVINTRSPAKAENNDQGQEEPDKDTLDNFEPALRSLYACLPRSKGKRKTTEALKYLEEWFSNIGDDTPKSIAVLAEWVKHRLTKAPHSRHTPAPSTVYNHLTTIGRRLIGQLGFEDITKLLEEDFIELYEIAIEDGESPQSKRSITWVLRKFHEWLSKTYTNVPDLGETGVFSLYGKRVTAVDANLISVGVFNRAIRWIEQSERWDEERREAAVLLMALGFYSGLRRSEAINLQVCDLSRSDLLHIQLKRRENSLLKTKSSIRQIPAGLFLPENQCERLRVWREQRDDKEMLFTLLSDNANEGSVITKYSGVFDIIKEALWRSSHDSTLRFHHLRHSFASWMMLSLFIAEQSEYFNDNDGGVTLPDWFLPEKETRTMLIEQCKHRRKELLGKTPTSRRQAWLVASLIGHLGPDVTITHYIHLMDVMLGMSIRASTPEISRKALANISGVSLRHLERLLTALDCRKLSIADRLDVLSDYFIDLQSSNEDIKENTRKAPDEGIIYEKPVSTRGKIELIAKGINVAASQPHNIGDFSAEHGVGANIVNIWVDQFKSLPPEVKSILVKASRADKDRKDSLQLKLPNTEARWDSLSSRVEQFERVLGKLGIDTENVRISKRQQDDINVAKSILEAWVSRQGGGLIIGNLMVAKKLLKWLPRIGIAPDAISMYFLQNKKSSIAIPSQKKYWEKTLRTSLGQPKKPIRYKLPSRGGVLLKSKQLQEIIVALSWLIICSDSGSN